MALIPCSQSSKQISSFTTPCPACGAPTPQLNAVPPPLPSELRAAKGTDPRIIAVAAVVGFVPLLAVLDRMAKEPKSTAPSVASSSSQFTAAPAEHFPRAIPVPSGLDRFFRRIKCLDVTSILKQLFHDVVRVVIKARANSVIVGLPNKIEYIIGYTDGGTPGVGNNTAASLRWLQSSKYVTRHSRVVR